MHTDDVAALIATAFPAADIDVQTEGGHYTVTIIDGSFEGVRSVKRQQQVYAPLAEVIAGGLIHAVNIRAMTPEEAGR